ncbi:putative Phage tail collar domain family protein [Tenacibaculum sp. 190524A02b]|uniref:Phage tail collar domain family protein n=1 Tax=Tenacibaculum vairaonense TaxID=3137860 RepID=A0ABP1FG39_9FLAO
MDKINFLQTGGYRLELETFDKMQSSYYLLQSFGELVGTRAIIKGCEINGTQISDGVVYIDGELFPFKGGTFQPTVIILEKSEKIEFENGEEKDTFFHRWVECGIGTEEIAFKDLKRFDPTKGIHKEIKFIGGSVSNEDLPPNWYIANGSNGTDDLRDTFIKVKQSFEVAGNTVGSHERKLSVSNIPKMDVKFTFGSSRDSQTTSAAGAWEASHRGTTWHAYTASVGTANNKAINIEPKAYLVVAIQYIKP